jgi:hypothetical protein
MIRKNILGEGLNSIKKYKVNTVPLCMSFIHSNNFNYKPV